MVGHHGNETQASSSRPGRLPGSEDVGTVAQRIEGMAGLGRHEGPEMAGRGH